MNQKTFHQILQEMTPVAIKNSKILNKLNFKLDSYNDLHLSTPYLPIEISNPYYKTRVNELLDKYPNAFDFKSDSSIILFKKLDSNKRYGSEDQKAGSILQLSKGLSFKESKNQSGNWQTGFKKHKILIKFNRNIVTIEDTNSKTYTIDVNGISREQLLSTNNPITPILTQLIESYFK